MFQLFGKISSRYGVLVLAGWVVLLFGLGAVAPPWDQVVNDGEFRFLPDDVASRLGERAFGEAFTRDLLGSSVVIVARRESNDEGLLDQDYTFIEDVLKTRIVEIANEDGGLASQKDEDEKETEAERETKSDGLASHGKGSGGQNSEPQRSIISRVRTSSDKAIGHLLNSEDNKASLIIVELTTEFTAYRNRPTIDKIEKLIGDLRVERDEDRRTPAGLDLALSGSALVGRDMKRAQAESASATEMWTILLVMILLVSIYRAPILAFIPLATVYVAVTIALKTLAILAQADIMQLFNGIEIYVTVVLYGAGVDYCMFLMARYKEELDAGATFDEAIIHSVSKVGAALAASAGTTMCGIGMMVFAQFGKLQMAGLAMSFSLFFVLAASLSFTPSLLRLCGRWAFWPQMRTERIAAAPGWLSPTSLVAKLMERDWFSSVWDRIAEALLARPGTILVGCVAAMSPFAIVAVSYYNFLSYGLLSELPRTEPSVVGTEAVQLHFPAGATGPVTLLLKNHGFDFSQNDGIHAIESLTQNIYNEAENLGINDVRSVSNPTGMRPRAREDLSKLPMLRRLGEKRIRRKRAVDFYVSDRDEAGNHVTRLDVVFKDDPFSRNSMQQLDHFRERIASLLPKELAQASELFYIGPTPSIRDLKTVTNKDQIRIDILVVAGVFFILMILLRRPAISGYLIVSVFFSYLVTLGITFVVFYSLDPTGFSGLDWKVPMFLFTILIAVGEDYNIYLITRIDEEQLRHGPVKGVTVALKKTGSIISSCGLIMAGTFSSLMAGVLVGMNQLGFALACGVLLDTFIVRPILVPAYLILLHSGRFGGFGKFLGAREFLPTEMTASLKIGSDGREH